MPKRLHFSPEVGEWVRCVAEVDRRCYYAESHRDDFVPPEGALSKKEFLAKEREEAAAKKAVAAERKRERNRRAQQRYRERRRLEAAAKEPEDAPQEGA